MLTFSEAFKSATAEPAPSLTMNNEIIRLRLAVSNAIDTWAILEHELSLLLQAVVNDEHGMVGTAIYYASTNTETSLRIVDAAIKAATYNLTYGRAVAVCWEKMQKKVADSKGKRNSIAHWYTSEVSINGKGPFFWLVDPAAGPKSLRKMKPMQVPKGLSANDLQEYDRNLRILLKDVRAFGAILTDVLTLDKRSEGQLLFCRNFHQLAAQLKIRVKPGDEVFWPPAPVDMSRTPSK